MLDRKTDRRGLGTAVLAMVVGALGACTRVDLEGPGGRIVIDSRDVYRPKRRRGRYDPHHDDDDDDDDD